MATQVEGATSGDAYPQLKSLGPPMRDMPRRQGTLSGAASEAITEEVRDSSRLSAGACTWNSSANVSNVANWVHMQGFNIGLTVCEFIMGVCYLEKVRQSSQG